MQRPTPIIGRRQTPNVVEVQQLCNQKSQAAVSHESGGDSLYSRDAIRAASPGVASIVHVVMGTNFEILVHGPDQESGDEKPLGNQERKPLSDNAHTCSP